MMDGNTQEEGRVIRQRRKQTDPLCCPVCGITVRAIEMAQHFSFEVDRLHKLSSGPNRPRKSVAPSSPKDGGGSQSGGAQPSDSNGGGVPQETTWGTYQKIKNNRQARLKLKSRKRKADETVCPVCNDRTSEDITVHVEHCLRRTEAESERSNGHTLTSDDESIDIEGGESYEEYEWAGQTRIRTTTLLEGGITAAGLSGGTCVRAAADEDEDLNVDGDDTQIYGPAQYTERDVVVPFSDQQSTAGTDNSVYLRSLVIGENPPSENTEDVNTFPQDIHMSAEATAAAATATLPWKKQSPAKTSSDSTLEMVFNAKIDSLKARIREYETLINNKSKCLICMDEYKAPAVSICCWHVHCEECWLHTLGARKLCPQCNMITSPTDLRRIYM